MNANFGLLAAGIALSGVFMSTVLQAEEMPLPPGPARMQWCKDKPEACEKLRAEREARCAQNPERCEKMKQAVTQQRAKCEADPEKCAKHKAQAAERRKQHQAKCEADPKACEERRAQRQARRDEHREHCAKDPQQCPHRGNKAPQTPDAKPAAPENPVKL